MQALKADYAVRTEENRRSKDREIKKIREELERLKRTTDDKLRKLEIDAAAERD